MTTCRQLIRESLRRFNALAPGDDLHVDEIEVGLAAIQNLVLRLSGGREPLTDIDVTADYTPGENERVRVQSGYTVSITLPNAISTSSVAVNDYGFRSSSPPIGSTASANGTTFRAPRDGARIEIVYLSSGTAPVLYVFRADIDTWVNVAALTIDADMPLNSMYLQEAAAVLAVQLCGQWPGAGIINPTAQMLRDEAMARGRLFGRPSVRRDAVRADYY